MYSYSNLRMYMSPPTHAHAVHTWRIAWIVCAPLNVVLLACCCDIHFSCAKPQDTNNIACACCAQKSLPDTHAHAGCTTFLLPLLLICMMQHPMQLQDHPTQPEQQMLFSMHTNAAATISTQSISQGALLHHAVHNNQNQNQHLPLTHCTMQLFKQQQ